MTPEKSIKILKAVKELKDDAIYTLTDLTEAYKMAIEALSRQNESSEQADHIADSDKMVDQFRGITKKTDDVSISKQEVLTNIRKLCDGCYLMEHCGQCNLECRLRQAIDMIEESSSVPMIPKKPSENGESEMNSMDEWWKNYIRSRMNRDDGTDTNVGSTNFKLGDNGYVALSEKVTATIYDDEHEEWTQETMTIADVLDSVCDDYTVIHSAQPEPVTDCHGLTGDLISRQKAINAFHYYFRDGFEEDKWWNSTHVLAAIEGLPSEQSKLKWETCFDCPLSHGCPKIKGCTNEQAIEYASQIPNDCPLSTQPEIIHCEDCRWYEKSHYCGANLPAPDGFCSWAERRNDG